MGVPSPSLPPLPHPLPPLSPSQFGHKHAGKGGKRGRVAGLPPLARGLRRRAATPSPPLSLCCCPRCHTLPPPAGRLAAVRGGVAPRGPRPGPRGHSGPPPPPPRRCRGWGRGCRLPASGGPRSRPPASPAPSPCCRSPRRGTAAARGRTARYARTGVRPFAAATAPRGARAGCGRLSPPAPPAGLPHVPGLPPGTKPLTAGFRHFPPPPSHRAALTPADAWKRPFPPSDFRPARGSTASPPTQPRGSNPSILPFSRR
jgi:hypothetical protein